MAANKFATMLHRNTHKLTIVLVYAVLEWTLIILLLLNSLFGYLITKFADYFGLKPPCPWCSRVDHVLEPGNARNCFRAVCETHATEISRLSYCSNHRRLAETRNMCGDCLASRPNQVDQSSGMRRIAFISLVSKNALENGETERAARCSCCNETLSGDLYPPYLFLKPSWGTLKYTQKGSLIIEAIDDESKELSKHYNLLHCTNEIEWDDGEDHQNDGSSAHEHQMLSDVGSFGLKDAEEEEEYLKFEPNLQEVNEDQKQGSPYVTEQASYSVSFLPQSSDSSSMQCCFQEDDSLEFINLHFESKFNREFNRLVPVEWIDLSTAEDQISYNLTEEDLKKQRDHQAETSDSVLRDETQVNGLRKAELAVHESKEKMDYTEGETVEIFMEDDEDCSNLNLQEMKKGCIAEACREVRPALEFESVLPSDNNVSELEKPEPDDLPAQEEEIDDMVDQTESKNSRQQIEHAMDQQQEQEPANLTCFQQENHRSSSENEAEIPNGPQSQNHPASGENVTTEDKMIADDKNKEEARHHLSIRSDTNEEEDKFPETPTSVDSIHCLHKKLLLEKRESGTDESLDGSMVSEMEAGDPVLTVERLKSALKVERNALSALYSELEEERSASAIAANQTMAMINRLQEEKAAMQMEALQYQRMMEEQSEYDQEALQLLNELMIKKEKEKQELEKELEVYRKKVLEYEAKEKLRLTRRFKAGSTRSTSSSTSCSIAEDMDELSIDLNREAREEDGSITENQESSNKNASGDEVINLEEIALDCVKQMSALDDTFTEFEEERLSILNQLKALEEKLITMSENEFSEDVNSVSNSSKYCIKGIDESCGLNTPEENGISNALCKDQAYPERKSMGCMAKNLLPLLDAADDATEEGLILGGNMESEFAEMEDYSAPKFESDCKQLAIVEEVDHVYKRLQALEADREFLQHCMSSIHKGDKGMDLLQEILQHLRDLRAVELQVRDMNDDSPLG